MPWGISEVKTEYRHEKLSSNSTVERPHAHVEPAIA
jgi:hypothetical protein